MRSRQRLVDLPVDQLVRPGQPVPDQTYIFTKLQTIDIPAFVIWRSDFLKTLPVILVDAELILRSAGIDSSSISPKAVNIFSAAVCSKPGLEPVLDVSSAEGCTPMYFLSIAILSFLMSALINSPVFKPKFIESPLQFVSANHNQQNPLFYYRFL